jgi:hypothetical protein
MTAWKICTDRDVQFKRALLAPRGYLRPASRWQDARLSDRELPIQRKAAVRLPPQQCLQQLKLLNQPSKRRKPRPWT